MLFQSFIDKVQDIQEMIHTTVDLLRKTISINGKSVNDENSQGSISSSKYESPYNDDMTSHNQNSNNLESESKLDDNEFSNANRNDNIDDLKEILNIYIGLINDAGSNLMNISKYTMNIIKNAQNAIKLSNHPIIRRLFKLSPYICNWISSALSTTINRYLLQKKTLSSFLSSLIGSLTNGSASYISLMFVKCNKWEALKEALMWGGSFYRTFGR